VAYRFSTFLISGNLIYTEDFFLYMERIYWNEENGSLLHKSNDEEFTGTRVSGTKKATYGSTMRADWAELGARSALEKLAEDEKVDAIEIITIKLHYSKYDTALGQYSATAYGIFYRK